MFLELYNAMVEFLQGNVVLVALLMAIVEYVKRAISGQEWVEAWMITAFAFALGFVLAIPEAGFVDLAIADYIAHSIGLGLVATGVYKIGETLVRK